MRGSSEMTACCVEEKDKALENVVAEFRLRLILDSHVLRPQPEY